MIEIDRVLHACWGARHPVYIQVPSNISYLMIDVPDGPFDMHVSDSDPERLETAVNRIMAQLSKAKKPALLVDMDVARSGLVEGFKALVDKAQIPYATLGTGKCILDETHPLWLGMYRGKDSSPRVREHVEGSDCLIVTDPCFSEGSSLLFTEGMPSDMTVHLRGFDVTISGEVYEGVTAKQFLDRLVEKASGAPRPRSIFRPCPTRKSGVKPSAALTQARLWPQIAPFIKENDVVIAEMGTSHIALVGTRLPSNVKYICQSIWGAIGFTLPALLGSMTANPDRRHLLFIGDGSFQLTAQELSTILNRGLKPIIFLVNNRGYTIERYILGMKEHYNDIANWKYADLPACLRPKSMSSPPV